MASQDEFTAFATIVREGSFSAAARLLGLQASTLTRRIDRLETRLNVQLMHRSTRNLALTQAGRLFADRALDIAGRISDAETAVAELNDAPRGLLRVTGPASGGSESMAPMIVDFLRRYPDVQVEVDLRNAHVDLVAEGFDVAVRAGRLVGDRLIARRVLTASLVCVASPDYLNAHGRPRTAEDLATHQCLCRKPNDRWRSINGEIPVNGRLFSNTLEVARAAALLDHGIALLPRENVLEALQSGALEEVLPGLFELPGGGVWLVYPDSRHVPRRTRAFVDHAVEWFQRHRWTSKAEWP